MLSSPPRDHLKTNHVEVFLQISDFEDITHAQLTELVGVQPSRIFVKGQPYNPKIGAVSKRNRWLLFAYGTTHPLFEDQVDALSALMTPRMATFQYLCRRYTCTVGCAVKIYVGNGESTPSVHLERRHVELLEALGAEFDVDIYACRPEE
jgi:hypothetical protein